MIIDKTPYFLSLRQFPIAVTSFVSIDGILDTISDISLKVTTLNVKLERNTLPNFDCKSKRTREVEALKEDITRQIATAQNNIKNFSIRDKVIDGRVKGFLLEKLKIAMMNFKSAEQVEYRQNEELIKTFDCENELVQETMKRNSNIKANILSLTNSVIQLKMLVKSQNEVVDSIDHYFDQSNEFLKSANKEIEKLPAKYTKFKDYLIYCLLYVVCVLLLLILIKSYNQKIHKYEAYKGHFDKRPIMK